MAKIIQYNENMKRTRMQNRTDYESSELKQYSDIEKQLRLKNQENKYGYTIEEIKNIVDDILKVTDYYNKNCATPIVKIVDKIGIETYKVDFKERIEGALFVNGTTKEIYNRDAVILVSNKDKLYYHRFVIAHQLACFLFEYLGSESDRDKRIVFSDKYTFNNCSAISETLKNRFALKF